MSTLKIILTLVVILLVAVVIAVLLDYRKHKDDEREKRYSRRDIGLFGLIGFIVNFFDVLGIGSFAPTLAMFNIFDLKVEERYIGGTLNAGVAGVVLFEALLFLSSVEVDMKTMLLMEAAALAGTFLGVKLNEKIDVNLIRLIMGIGLLMAGFLILAGKIGIYPVGGELTGITGGKLIIAIIVTFVLGAALMFGIGNYAPCMAVVYLLGMSPICAFPIMMLMGGMCSSSSAFQSMRNGLLCRKPAVAMMVTGFAGAALAYYVVKSMPLSVLQWVVIIAVTYAAIQLFVKVAKSKKEQAEETA